MSSSPQSPECDHRSTEKGVQAYIQDWVRILYDATGDQTKVNRAIELADLNGLFDPVRFAASPPAHQENSPRSLPEPAPQVREALNGIWRLLDIASAAGRKMRLQKQAGNLRHSHEVRMFAVELARGNADIGGAYWDAKQTVKKLATALIPVVAREPVGWRWRPKVEHKGQWIYDPEPAWLEAHRHEIECEPLFTSPPPASAVREALEKIANAPAMFPWARDLARKTLSIKGTADELTKSIGIREI